MYKVEVFPSWILTTAAYVVKFGVTLSPVIVMKAPLFPIVSLDTKIHSQLCKIVADFNLSRKSSQVLINAYQHIVLKLVAWFLDKDTS